MRNKKYSDIMLSIGEIFKFNIKENKMNKNIVVLDGKSLGDISYEKLNNYASQCVDPQIKQMFTKSAQDALNTKQKLMTFFN